MKRKACVSGVNSWVRKSDSWVIVSQIFYLTLKGLCEYLVKINISKVVIVCVKEGNGGGWQSSIRNIYSFPLEEQFENYRFLAEATFQNT